MSRIIPYHKDYSSSNMKMWHTWMTNYQSMVIFIGASDGQQVTRCKYLQFEYVDKCIGNESNTTTIIGFVTTTK